MSTPVLAAVALAIVGPLLTYLGVVRKLSGKIATSDASQLWKESAAMRDDYRKQLVALNEVIGSLRERLAVLEASNERLTESNERLTASLITANRELDDLRRGPPPIRQVIR